jgi:hypothetical protein
MDDLTTEAGEAVRNKYRREGAILERRHIVNLIERRICFDALADPDGRCNHHGGKCYDLRQLIKDLNKGTPIGS